MNPRSFKLKIQKAAVETRKVFGEAKFNSTGNYMARVDVVLIWTIFRSVLSSEVYPRGRLYTLFFLFFSIGCSVGLYLLSFPWLPSVLMISVMKINTFL